jgi:hypothetical protein
MEEDLIMDLISPGALDKYQRFKRIRSDQNLRDCPGAPGSGGCGQLVTARKGWVWGVYPEMECNKCSHRFCLVHSNAHPGRTCREYELAEREKTAAEKAAIAGEQRSLSPLSILKCSFCRDRLGTNIGEALKKELFSSQSSVSRAPSARR